MAGHSSLLRRLGSGGHLEHMTKKENGKVHKEKMQTHKQSQYLQTPYKQEKNGKGGKVASLPERGRELLPLPTLTLQQT